jgi:hypothetical protein
MNLGEGASLVAVARNADAAVDPDAGNLDSGNAATGTTPNGIVDAGGAPTKGES